VNFDKEKLGSQIESELEVQDDGDTILHRREIPDRELSPLELVMQVDILDKRIEQAEEDIEDMEDRLEARRDEKDNLEDIKADLDAVVEECRDKVVDYIREQVDEVKGDVEARVRREYDWDQAETREMNRKQLLKQYQTYIMRHEDLSEFPLKYVRQVVQEEAYAGNPFQNAQPRDF